MLNPIPAENESFRPELGYGPPDQSCIAEGQLHESADGRSTRRFCVRIALKCRLVEPGQRVGLPPSTGTIVAGESVEISSKDLVFASSHVFVPGQVVEIFIDWPVLLENGVRLTLCVEGPVTNRVPGLTGMDFYKYRFKTRGRAD